jgi:hypothetical protein
VLSTLRLYGCRDNVDYIVDWASAALRSSYSFAGSNGNSASTSCRAHLVVNIVFEAIGDHLFAETSHLSPISGFIAPIALLKDMVLDTVDSVDVLVGNGFKSSVFQVLFLMICLSVVWHPCYSFSACIGVGSIESNESLS